MNAGVILEFLNMGGGEIMLILAVVMLLFGGKKLPELARGLGKGIRDFKDASDGVKREIHRNINAMDIDEDLNSQDKKYEEERSKSATETLEEQMYPTTANTTAATDSASDVPAAVEETPPLVTGTAPVLNTTPVAGTTPVNLNKNPPVVNPDLAAVTPDQTTEDQDPSKTTTETEKHHI